MTRAVVLSHEGVAHELGVLGDWLASAGYAITRRWREVPADIPSADLLVVLGSPDSVATGHCAPAGTREVAQVRDWISADRPYLGVCFGAQVLASALGGQVRRMSEPDRGWMRLACSDSDAAFAGPWMVWHNDAILAPPTAQVRARSQRADQAFSRGRAWGVQFHPELDSASMERMAVALGADAEDYAPIVAAMHADEAGHRTRALSLFDTALASAAG